MPPPSPSPRDTLRLFRHLLRAAARFPSIKRAAILADIKVSRGPSGGGP